MYDVLNMLYFLSFLLFLRLGACLCVFRFKHMTVLCTSLDWVLEGFTCEMQNWQYILTSLTVNLST